MKTIIAVFLIALVFPGLAAAQNHAARKLTFERDDFVWIANSDGSAEKKIAEGQSPEFSPNGTKLAYTTYNSADQMGPRKIAILDLATNATTVLKDIPSDHCMDSRWSPDGKQLLVSFNVDSDSRLGLVKADGTGFRYVRQSETEKQDYWSFAWSPDGQSFFAQDMDSLYRLDLNGKVLKKWTITQLVPSGSMSSDIRLDCSPDGKKLLMDVEMDEKEREGWEGPPPSIWLLDLATEKATRLTPKNLYAWESHWLDAPNTILCVVLGVGEKDPSVYSMSVSGKGADKKLLVKNGRNPGISR